MSTRKERQTDRETHRERERERERYIADRYTKVETAVAAVAAEGGYAEAVAAPRTPHALNALDRCNTARHA